MSRRRVADRAAPRWAGRAVPDPAGDCAQSAGADPAGTDPAGADPAGTDPAGTDPAGDGAPSAGADPPAPAAWAAGDRAVGQAGGPRVSATASRVLAGTLWAALGLALLLGLVNCAQRPAAPPAVDDTAGGTPPPAAPPAGCAELVVAAWLSGDAGALLAGDPAAASPPPVQRRAARLHTLSVTPGPSPDRWSYLVGAAVAERAGEGEPWRHAGAQYFAVTMVAADGGCHGWRPAALPRQVAPPALGVAGGAPYPATLPRSGTPLSDTLAAFFRGLLAGAGDIDRYLAPGAAVTPLVPPPFAEVGIVEVRATAGTPERSGDEVPPDGTTLRLLVTVSADRAPLPLAYPVTVSVRGGRWEVAALDPVVGAATAAPSPSPEPPTP